MNTAPTGQSPSGGYIPPRQRSFARAVGSYVPKLTQKAMQKFGFSTAALFADWPSIVGRELASHTQPQRLKWPRASENAGDLPAEECGRPGATLVLQVSAARALDIQYKGAQIVERINAYFGYRAIAELRIVQVPVGPEPRQPTPRDVVAQKARPSTPGPDLSKIEDPGLREALERMQRGIAKR